MEIWFEDCEGKIELRALPIESLHGQAFYGIEDLSGIGLFSQKNQGKDLYFGAATRNGSGGTKADIVDIPGVWADVDFKTIPEEQADKLLKECPLQPSFLIGSGGGYHVYWKFKEPTQNVQAVESINHQVRAYFGSDNVGNADRILRLPDTLNQKYEPKRPVKVLVDNETRYDQSDFQEHLPPVETICGPGQADKAPGWQDELLNGVGEGQRNSTAVKLAGRCLAKGLSKEETFTYLNGWNQKNKPPLDSAELAAIVENVSKTDARRHPQVEPLKFPDVMAGVAGRFARLYAKHLEPPEHFFYTAFLTCLGSTLSGRLTLPLETDPQPRLYMILLGESADDRKSTTLTKTVEFFRDTIESFPTCWGIGSAEGLQARFRRETKENVKTKRLLLCFDEFKQFINKCKIEGSVLLPCINSLFELNHWESNVKNSSIELNGVHLSMLAASTVQTYERIWTASFTDIGFTNRLFLVPGEGTRQFSLPGKIPEGHRRQVKAELAGILGHVGDGLELPITQEARDMFQEWYMALERSIHTKRLEIYATRLMPLLAVNELKFEVDGTTIEKAMALADWQLNVRREHDPIDADNAIAEMEERIRRYLRNEDLTERDLRRKLHRIIERTGVFCFTRAVQNLRAGREIYLRREEKGFYLHYSG